MVVCLTNDNQHKYNNEAILEPATPKLNIFFEHERDAYTRLSSLSESLSESPSESPIAPIPKYYGYMRFTKPPQVNAPGSIPRKLFKSTTYRPAVYTDFLTDRGHNDSWMDYFLNKSGNVILQGLVLEEIAGRHICDSDASNPNIARSGREGLKAIHKRGVLHGDVKNQLNALSSVAENRVTWIDFSMCKVGADISASRFTRKACQEIRDWDSCFKAGIGRS
jgi:serine/threonine protein kinase